MEQPLAVASVPLIPKKELIRPFESASAVITLS